MASPSSPSASTSIPALEPPAPRLEFLDGLRALAALYVVLNHSSYEVWPLGLPTAPAWTHILYYGHTAVDLFIVISGFSLMLPIVRGRGSLRGGAFNFFKKRARRIVPPYYFALIFSLMLIVTLVGRPTGTHWDISLPVTFRDVIYHILLLQDFLPQDLYKINHAFWSISLEWWIYFLFPALVFAWKRFGVGITLVLSFALTLALCTICVHKYGQTFTLQYIALFVMGMLGCEIVYTQNPALQQIRDRLPWEPMTVLAAGVFALAVTGNIPHLTQLERSDVLAGFCAMCLLVLLSIRSKNLLRRILSRKPMMFLGSFAYSLYLIHAPLIQVIWQYMLHPLHLSPTPTFVLLAVLGAPMIIAASYVFFLFCERPFMGPPGKQPPSTMSEAEVAAVINPAP